MRFVKYAHHRFSDIDIEWINSIPKTINNNGCWIPDIRPIQNGYVRLRIETQGYFLHRLVVCVKESINYHDKWDSRHGQNCVKACFNPEHLQSGTAKDNSIDSVLHKDNWESKKEVCPKCGGPYRNMKRMRYGVVCWTRVCVPCRVERDANKYRERNIHEKSL